LGLLSLILVHELGHFLAARMLKVDVDEFGIGFPPRLLGTARDENEACGLVYDRLRTLLPGKRSFP
jgi:membrane-associated protease RseP (regulator of RpoE activity)